MASIATVILAAGASKRLGFNKLCVRVNGEAVIRRTVRLFMQAGSSEIAVVTGFERERVEKELSGLPVSFFHNERHEDGMSASIRAALPFISRAGAVLFHLGDKPFVEPAVIDLVTGTYGADEGNCSIVVPVHDGVPGHPVLVDMRRHLEAVGAGEGAFGLRDVIAAAGDRVRMVEGGEGCVLDLDTEEDIAFLERRGYSIEKG
jgi:molybdenum cofactor cytidylyltransferase